MSTATTAPTAVTGGLLAGGRTATAVAAVATATVAAVDAPGRRRHRDPGCRLSA